MKAMILDAGSPESCQPLTCTRPLAACRVGNRLLAEVQQEVFKDAGFGGPDDGDARTLFVRGDVWLSRAVLAALLKTDGPVAVRNAADVILAWTGAFDPAGLKTPSIPADAETFLITYPWDVLKVNEIVLKDYTGYRLEGEVVTIGQISTASTLANGAWISDGVHIDGALILGPRSRVLPGVYIEGTVVVGDDCKIGPNCYLRGRTSIGNGCHIGQSVEIKNSIVMDRTSIGHLSYCGDSVIGEAVNFGAGTITANFRHDGMSHRSMAGGQLVNTCRRKFGAVIGDHVHTGIHTSIYPGRKLWPGTTTLPGAVVSMDITK
jgi:bifunctional UDP-N-acetylglucosamine pyrophosphorylase/glucosamine-1-phosphate N-acetyltransferase